MYLCHTSLKKISEDPDANFIGLFILFCKSYFSIQKFISFLWFKNWVNFFAAYVASRHEVP